MEGDFCVCVRSRVDSNLDDSDREMCAKQHGREMSPCVSIKGFILRNIRLKKIFVWTECSFTLYVVHRNGIEVGVLSP